VDPHTRTHDPAPGYRAADGHGAAGQVTALYQAHAPGLVRLAMVMLGDQHAAEDVVQDAFLGLFRRWDSLNDPGRALAYVRSSVLNGCRDVIRKSARRDRMELFDVGTASAEASVLLAEEHLEVLRALRRLPARQREAVVLRHCLSLTETEAAAAMNVSRGTVKSASSRGLAALNRVLKEKP
jgi:RNA polymerase sigma-70 factor (sigma-E family)